MRYPLDLVVRAGEPLDVSVPVLDVDGLPVSLTGGWTAQAQVRRGRGAPILHTFTPSIEATSVRVTATGAETAGWADTWATAIASWDVLVTAPDGSTHYLGPGRIHVLPTITHI